MNLNSELFIIIVLGRQIIMEYFLEGDSLRFYKSDIFSSE